MLKHLRLTHTNFIILSIIILLSICIFWWFYDSSVYWEIADKELLKRFYRNDVGQSRDRSWIPASAFYSPKSWCFHFKSKGFTTGFPNGDMGYYSNDTASSVILTVHLYDNYAHGITISFKQKDINQAISIKEMLNQKFPRLSIRLFER